MNIEQQMQDIDAQLGNMPKRKRMMLYVSVAAALIGAGYYFVGLDFQEDAEVKAQRIMVLEESIRKNDLSSYEHKIAKEKERILLLAQKQEQEQYLSTSLHTKLEGMRYLNTDAQGMAAMLERILKHSVVLGVNIHKVTVDYSETDFMPQITRRGKIIIDGDAPFYCILKLMRFVESQKALIKIEDVNMRLTDELKEKDPAFALTITGYGIEL
ncbi:MAG: hypothetical protein MUP09_10885 [Thiovulaceae bacterium]|nr:hypothetical protein [Sulfurimonadaceae bacterium]